MIWRRRGAWIVVGAVMAITLSALAYVFSGSSAIESWVGSQLLEIGGTYLGPVLRFERLTYVRPRTILLDNVTLSSPDPGKPGHSAVILAVKHARLELTEIPRRGRPIRFSRVLLETPVIQAIAATPGGAKLLGLSNLVKGSMESRGDASGPAPMKLSDFLLIRHVEIVNGTVSYDPRSPDMPPILLDGINARLDFTPAGTSSNPGVYTIATTISRKPAVEFQLEGQVDIDTLIAELGKLELTLDLQEQNAHFLPPELQRFLKSCEVTGHLRVTASGKLPLANWRQGTLQSQGELTRARVATGQHRLAIGVWTWEVEVVGGRATIRKADAQLLGGDLHITGAIPLDGTQSAQLDVNFNNLQIQQILRSSKAGDPPLYAGNLAANITFSAPLATWNQHAGGGGTFSIRQGRIHNMPLLGPIVTSINQSLTKALSADGRGLTDAADGQFTFSGDGVHVEHFAGTSGAMAFRATGTIGFDRRLALHVNAGPMESLQNSLGELGKAWASVSDAMAGYQVTGSLADPQVSIELGSGR